MGGTALAIAGSPTFRNPQLFEELPYRRWIRAHLPWGRSGYVVEDVDMVVRVYGTAYVQDETGAFMLIELKYKRARMGYAQRRTFGLLHRLLRRADPNGERYKGFYLVQYDDEDWDKARFTVNGVKMSRERYAEFLCFDLDGVPDAPRELIT